MNKIVLAKMIYLSFMFVFLGCGGGGSSSDSSSSGESGNSDASSNSGSVESLTWTPKATNVTCDLSQIDGGTYSA